METTLKIEMIWDYLSFLLDLKFDLQYFTKTLHNESIQFMRHSRDKALPKAFVDRMRHLLPLRHRVPGPPGGTYRVASHA